MVGGGGDTADNAKRPMALGEEVYETSMKSCGQSIQSVVGDSCERQVGDKCEIMRTKTLRASSVYWETSERQA